jgi:predicted nucleic acid-binding Zn ribbon protein
MSGRPDDRREGGPRPVGTSLDEVSRRLGLRDARGIGRLFTNWEGLVGAAMALHVQPVRLDAEALVVAVDHPAWATEVRQLGEELLDRVSEETGAPRPRRMEIRVRR